MLHRVRVLLVILLLSTLIACGGGGGGSGTEDKGGGSSNKLTSHNAGQNCMNCHSTNGAASTMIFNAAGTIYKSSGDVQTNATVRLFITGTNTLVANLETDDSGNFYTTEIVDGLFYGMGFVSGVDVEVHGPGGIRTMNGLITAAACGACHGVSRGNVIAN